MLEDILSQVQKPGRYIAGEWNVSRKDFRQSYIKFALCFPDLYEVGMSNLGIRIIYGLLNNIPDATCERFFAPAKDLQGLLRSTGREIFSLESRRKLREFDMIGFSLGYELNYTNVLNMLELGAIPVRASGRNYEYPLVIGGGPCALNPEPIYEFFDLFVIGEAEEVIVEITDCYRKAKDKFKSGRLDKQDLLVMLANIQGVYVPSLYEPVYDKRGSIEEFRPKVQGIPLKIKKRFLADLDSQYFTADWLVPYIQTVHDRVTLEIMRGCPNRCRFCQARTQYFPFRQRKMQDILNLATATYKKTGYEEISLGGLSVSDYPQLEPLLISLVDLFKEKAVGLSLPSIKPKTIIGNVSALIASIKKTGLTFAPEAATERMRKILAKDFNTQEFFRVVEEAFSRGYQHIKLYFMIGLPYEEESDLDGIVDFAWDVSQLRKKVNKGPAQVNISVNTLIPKAHTPFQWFKMLDLEAIKYKQAYLRAKVSRHRRLKLSVHNHQMSHLEGVLSRGDRRLSRVILLAHQKGAQFDAWQDAFDFEKWQEAFRESKVDPNFYLQEKQRDDVLPWDFLDLGVSKAALRMEADRIIEDTEK